MGFLNEKHYYSTSGSGKQGLFWEETPTRPVRPRAVDKSVDNVDNWEFGEFGSLTKRTYRYDYHASSIGWDITR